MKKKISSKLEKWSVKLLVMALLSIVWIGFYDFIPVEADSAVGSPKLAVLVDGRKVRFQGGEPVSENGRVQVPLRGIGEALKAEIGFSGKTVTYRKDGKLIALTLGSKEAVVNGKNVTMDTAAKAVKGRTYVPLRFVSENLGVPVNWDGVGNWVWIGSKYVPDITEVESVKKLSLNNNFINMFGTKLHLLDGKKDVRIFTIDDLPLRIDHFIVYDIWPVMFGDYQSIRIRFSAGLGPIYYLQQGELPRYRNSADPIKQSDKTIIRTYKTTSEYDQIVNNDVQYMQFKLNKAEYIGFQMGTESLTLLQNPFK
ncbi:copper amine oxidase N-terminal domain-containing protein [Paenibacillus sp. CR_12]|uniref:copper amine oxidase N-terminal domain-containing protein n=1 Tax=Paenibacillus sp. CR_12 TaxID=3055793 RepID=UPI0035BEEF71